MRQNKGDLKKTKRQKLMIGLKDASVISVVLITQLLIVVACTLGVWSGIAWLVDNVSKYYLWLYLPHFIVLYFLVKKFSKP